ncbi:MAG: linear amide C-N hydrolase [Erysipelothrix sp.]|nr:linear amide C-N hydrolase [Erysipelothrix sp.]
MIGMATVVDNYPLYAEATNEKGLSIAGLNFPKSAHYHPVSDTGYNISPYELIPYLLGRCETVKEIREILEQTTITNIDFNAELPLSPIHWMASSLNSLL